MVKHFQNVMLIDDSEADNFYHKLSIENTQLVSAITCCESANTALTMLSDGKHGAPELIFLDINMPAVNGWEFLDRYQEQLPPQQRRSKIYIASTSSNPADRQRAESHPLVSGFVQKPIDSDTFIKLSESLA